MARPKKIKTIADLLGMFKEGGQEFTISDKEPVNERTVELWITQKNGKEVKISTEAVEKFLYEALEKQFIKDKLE